MGEPIYAVWHGGDNYATSDAFMDRERFDSIEAAAATLAEREENGDWREQTRNYVHRAPDAAFLPELNLTSHMVIYEAKDSDSPLGEIRFDELAVPALTRY